MKKIVAITISLFLVLPPPAWAALRTFKPKIAGFFGSTEVNALYEQSEATSSSSTEEASVTAFREALTLGTAGYVYHPNFMGFRLKATEGMRQEKYETNDKGKWRQGTTEAYEARAFFLPAHPYNLEVFSSLSRPLIAGQLAGNASGRERLSHGTFFRYQKRPWNSSLNWTSTRAKSSSTWAKNNSYTSNVSFTKFTQLSGAARYNITTSSEGSAGEGTNFDLANQHSLNMFTLNSSWHQRGDNSMDKSRNTNNVRGRKWDETLYMNIPDWNLQPVVSYGLDRGKSNRLNLYQPTSERKDYINSETLSAGINPSLYQSIYTNGTINHTIHESSSGKQTMTNARGTMDYRKKIYQGSFNAGVWKSFNNMKRLGALTLLQDQAYNTAVAGNPFTISDRFVDETTIEITVTTPGLAEATLVKNFHYTATTTGDTVTILIINLPAPYNIINIDNYTLLLNYAFVNTNFELDTYSQGFSLHLKTLNGLLSPYYSFSQSNQELVGGALPGGVNNSKTHATGITVIKDPYLGGVNYSQTNSSRDSNKIWSGLGEYRIAMTAETNLAARLEAMHITSYRGDNEQPAENAENEKPEKIYKATLNSNTRWPKKKLSFSVGAAYARRYWIVNTSTSSFYSNLNWRLGKMEISLGTNYSLSSSTTATGNTAESNNMSIYLNINRELF